MMRLILITLLSIVATAWGYSAGAPEGVCDDMTPKHPVAPQKSRFPYKITLDKTEVKPEEEVLISIIGKPFKGRAKLTLEVRLVTFQGFQTFI